MGRIYVDGVRGSVAGDRSRSSSRFSFPLDLFHVFLFFFLMNWGGEIFGFHGSSKICPICLGYSNRT